MHSFPTQSSLLFFLDAILVPNHVTRRTLFLPIPSIPRASLFNMAVRPEGVLMEWDLSKEDIAKRADELIERARKVYDAVGALTPEQVTYENCLKVSNVYRM